MVKLHYESLNRIFDLVLGSIPAYQELVKYGGILYGGIVREAVYALEKTTTLELAAISVLGYLGKGSDVDVLLTSRDFLSKSKYGNKSVYPPARQFCSGENFVSRAVVWKMMGPHTRGVSFDLVQCSMEAYHESLCDYDVNALSWDRQDLTVRDSAVVPFSDILQHILTKSFIPVQKNSDRDRARKFIARGAKLHSNGWKLDDKYDDIMTTEFKKCLGSKWVYWEDSQPDTSNRSDQELTFFNLTVWSFVQTFTRLSCITELCVHPHTASFKFLALAESIESLETLVGKSIGPIHKELIHSAIHQNNHQLVHELSSKFYYTPGEPNLSCALSNTSFETAEILLKQLLTRQKRVIIKVDADTSEDSLLWALKNRAYISLQFAGTGPVHNELVTRNYYRAIIAMYPTGIRPYPHNHFSNYRGESIPLYFLKYLVDKCGYTPNKEMVSYYSWHHKKDQECQRCLVWLARTHPDLFGIVLYSQKQELPQTDFLNPKFEYPAAKFLLNQGFEFMRKYIAAGSEYWIGVQDSKALQQHSRSHYASVIQRAWKKDRKAAPTVSSDSLKKIAFQNLFSKILGSEIECT